MKLDTDAHPEVLGALHHDAVLAQQIAALQRLEPEVVKHEVAVVVNHLLILGRVLADQVVVAGAYDFFIVI